MKAQIYIASILAMSDMHDATVDGPGTYVLQSPALIPAASIEEAAEQTRNHALTTWPVADGWHSHQTAIVPITNRFHILVEANRLGEIESAELLADLPGKTFELSPEGFSLTQ